MIQDRVVKEKRRKNQIEVLFSVAFIRYAQQGQDRPVSSRRLERMGCKLKLGPTGFFLLPFVAVIKSDKGKGIIEAFSLWYPFGSMPCSYPDSPWAAELEG